MRSNRISCQFASLPTTSSNSISTLFFLVVVYSKTTLALQRCCRFSNQVLLIFNENPIQSACKENYLSHYHINQTIFEESNNASFLNNIPTCHDGFQIALDNRLDTWFREDTDGTLEVGLNFWFWPAWLRVKDDGSSCQEKNAKFISSSKGNESSDEAAILITCELQGLNTYLIHRGLYGALYMISFFFVLLILIIYGILWNEQNTHGVAQFSYFIGIALFYLTEGTRILVKHNGLNIQPSTYCFLHAIIAQYFFIIVNTTSIVLGFDLLWTLRKLDPTAYKAKIWKRIYAYIFLSWIAPLILVITALILNHYISPDARKNEAGFFEHAHYRCSSPLWQSGFYLQSVLYLLNIMLFILTSLLICKHRRSSQVPKSRRAKRLLHETISIHSRLFFILGMTWIAVIIEFFLGQNNPLSFLWLVLRVANLLLGILYFAMFGISRKHLSLLRAKFPLLQETLSKLGYDAETNFTEIGDTSQSGQNIEPGILRNP